MKCQLTYIKIVNIGVFGMPAILASMLLAGCATSHGGVSNELGLYYASYMMGPHSHPLGPEGRKLDSAEMDLQRRRDAMRAWLTACHGIETIDKLDENIEESVESTEWLTNISLNDEWRRIRKIRHNIEKLERQKLLSCAVQE